MTKRLKRKPPGPTPLQTLLQKASKRPYRVDSDSPRFITDASQNESVIAVLSAQNQESDATLLCHSANCLEELVEALKDCEIQLAINHPNSDKDSGPIKSARRKARTALAKAENPTL